MPPPHVSADVSPDVSPDESAGVPAEMNADDPAASPFEAEGRRPPRPAGPLLIGIAGGSGSGKTTVARRVREALPAGAVATLEHDAYYRDRPDLTFEERCQVNFDHPDSLETELCMAHLASLRRGEAVDAPLYDFRTHRRAQETRRVEPAPVVILEGILLFADPGLRDLLELKIYVDTDPDIRAFRRIRRDLEQRGRTFESIREQYYRTVRPMHLQFVEPSKRWADLILPEGGFNHVGVDAVVGMVRAASRREHPSRWASPP
jgi:uridine kinase